MLGQNAQDQSRRASGVDLHPDVIAFYFELQSCLHITTFCFLAAIGWQIIAKSSRVLLFDFFDDLVAKANYFRGVVG